MHRFSIWHTAFLKEESSVACYEGSIPCIRTPALLVRERDDARSASLLFSCMINRCSTPSIQFTRVMHRYRSGTEILRGALT